MSDIKPGSWIKENTPEVAVVEEDVTVALEPKKARPKGFGKNYPFAQDEALKKFRASMDS